LPDARHGLSARLATIQLYEAGDGVPAGLKTMTTAGRWPQRISTFQRSVPIRLPHMIVSHGLIQVFAGIIEDGFPPSRE
jgi:hypothetical protein